MTPTKYNLTNFPISRGMTWRQEFVFKELNSEGVKVPFNNSGLTAFFEVKTDNRTIQLTENSGITVSTDGDGFVHYVLTLSTEQTLKLNVSEAKFSFYFIQSGEKFERFFGTIPVIET